MAGVQVSPAQFAAKLGQRGEVEAALAAGMGMAIYSDGRGSRVAVTYGTRDADLPGLPPRMYGGGELELFMPAQPTQSSMKSPLLDYQPPPQISRPRVAPTQTAYPEVLINSRSSSHPRGDREYIDARRQLPGREQEQAPAPAPPPEPSTPDSQWWRDALRGG